MKKIIILCMASISQISLSEIYRVDDTINKRFWSFGIGVEENYYGTKEMPIQGISQVTTIGYGRLEDQYFWKAGGFLGSGPIKPIFTEKLILDSSSKGLFAEWGYSLFTPNMRSSFSSGPFFGLKQSDFTSETLGSREEVSSVDRRNYALSTKYSALSLEAGLFYCKAISPRVTGNRPDLLITRVEAWSLQISALIPMISKFEGRLETSDSTSFIDANAPRKTKKTNSKLNGYSILFHLDAWFGG
jgi:hypothetical protein